MYIIFCENTGILQFGSGVITKSSILNGMILTSGSDNINLSKHLSDINTDWFRINKTNHYYIATWGYLKSKKTNKNQSENNTPRKHDFRRQISNTFLIKFIAFCFKCVKFIDLNVKKISLISIILFIILSVHSIFNFKSFHNKSTIRAIKGQSYQSSVELDKSHTSDLEKWINIFNDSKLSNMIYQNKHHYYFGKIPKIKGISEFNIIPLINSTSDNEYSGYLLIPIKKVIAYRAKNDISYLIPLQTCVNKSNDTFYVFDIQSKDKAIIVLNDIKNLDTKKQLIKNDSFYLLPKSSSLLEVNSINNLCQSVQMQSI